MALSGRTPFNIRKVNGQWLFTDTIFGGSVPNLKKELLIVPEDLVPTSIYAGGKTGYIPEQTVIDYFNSAKFARTFSSVYASSNRTTRGMNLRMSPDVIAKQVKDTLSKVDTNANQQAFAATPGKKTIGGDTFAVSHLGESYDRVATEWGAGVSLARDDSSGYQYDAAKGALLNRNGTQMFYLPSMQKNRDSSKSLKLPAAGIEATEFSQNMLHMTSDQVKQWQVALKLPATGIYDDQLGSVILQAAQGATTFNWQHSVSGDTGGVRVMDPFSFLKFKQKADAAAGGKSTTSSSSQTTHFSNADAGVVITDLFQQLVGRDPSAEEQKQWAAKLNAAAKKDPSRSSSTTTRTGSHSSTTGTSSAGFGQPQAQLMVRNELAMTPESQSLRSSTTLYDAFLQAIQNPIG